MEDDKQEPTHSSRGNEWEVVSLTASTYAAAPSPGANGLTDVNNDNELTKGELDLSQLMSKSGFEHLVFPPNEHEDLLVDSDNSEICNSELMVQKQETTKHEAEHDKMQEQWNLPALTDSGAVDDIKFFDKGKMLSVDKMEFREETFQDVDGVDNDNQGHSFVTYSSNHDIINKFADGQTTSVPSTENPMVQDLGSPSHFQEKAKEHNYKGALREEWWKKQAASLYAHTKETDIYWSIFIAASVVGLIFVGKKWRQDIWRIF